MRPPELLQRAVEAGLVTGTQRDAILALDAEDHAPESSAGDGHTIRALTRSALRIHDGATIAYGVGALVVLFALVWVLADRWTVLGEGGIFALTVGYAVAFLAVASFLGRIQRPTARGIALLLAVILVPLATRALLRWVGFAPAEDLVCSDTLRPLTSCLTVPLVMEVATVAAVLLARRTAAFSPLMLPLAVVGITMPERFLQLAFPSSVDDGAALGWRWMVVASFLAAAAFLIDRRRRVPPDWAWPLWLAAAVSLFVSGTNLFEFAVPLRIWMAPASLAVVATAVGVRRRVLLPVGLAGVLTSLVWISNEVDTLTVAFPLLLALLGLLIMIGTRWLQRRRAPLVPPGTLPSIPRVLGGVCLLLLPALFGLAMLAGPRLAEQTDDPVVLTTPSRQDAVGVPHAAPGAHRAGRTSR